MQDRSFVYSLLLGAIAGLTYSLSLWGYEAVLFVRMHVAYPWLSLGVGTMLCTLLCTLAALLTHLVGKALPGLIFWVLTAGLIAELTVTIPLKISPYLMKLFEPGLRAALPAYPYTDTLQTWAGIGIIWLAIFFAIFGLLQLTLVEQAAHAVAPASRLTPYLICVPLMLLSSVMISNLVNEQLRAPLLSTDTAIQFAVDHQNTEVDPRLARQMHMGTINAIADLINRPRRLFLGKYDDYYEQVEVLIDFDGEWADCTTASGQPTYCRPVSSP